MKVIPAEKPHFETLKVLLLCCCAVFAGCEGTTEKHSEDYYLQRTGVRHEILSGLFERLYAEADMAECFSLVREIANQYDRLDDRYRLINFLSNWIETYPDDLYTSYYLLRIADCYIQEGSLPIAMLYFDIIVRNYPDLIVRDESIHLACLLRLIPMTDDPARKIWYYEQLITRFSDQIDMGATYFLQGQTYEQLGRWTEAIAAYRNFIPYYGTIVPGFPDAYYYAKQMVDLNGVLRNISSSAKLDHTFESIDSLLRTIHIIIDSGETYRLWPYRTRVNFFVRPWSQIGGEEEVTDFNISALNTAGKIQYASELSAGSGVNDVYLRTIGWSKYSPVWYLYFRKIYYPMDPAINGRWEWAGIYYGEAALGSRTTIAMRPSGP